MNEKKVIYDKNTIEFVTMTLEFCSLVESTNKHTLFSFTDKAVKILPLLYIKATLLPVEEDRYEEDDMEHFITEDTYETIRSRVAGLLGEFDSYLETFHPDMKYSDTPVAATISENFADIYQDLGNFVSLFRQENEDVMEKALYACINNFQLYWGQKLLNTLKALHVVRYNEEISPEKDNFIN